MTPICPDCGADHDPRRCAREGATCACCAALYPDADARAAAAALLDGETTA
jgi:hypothetical protein